MIPFPALATMAKWCAGMAPTVANHLWQSTIFAAVAAVLTLALRRNQARARHWLWMAASIKFLIPFSLLMSVGGMMAKPRAAAVAAQPSVYLAMEEVSQPFAEAIPPVVPVAAPAAPSKLAPLLPLLIAAVWVIGFGTVLCVWTMRWRRVAHAMRGAVPVREGREMDALRKLEQAGGLRMPIELRLSEASMEPGVFGLEIGRASAVLAWPAGISERLDDAHLEAILAHEVAHVRRRDNLTAAMHMLVEAIFWFHPLVWWLGARLLAERERACDEEVLLLCAQPVVYAEGILKVCEYCVESPLACVSGVTGADLKQRIVQIMTARVVRRIGLGRKLLLLGAGMVVVAVPVLAGRSKAMRLRWVYLMPGVQDAPSAEAGSPAAEPKPAQDATASTDATTTDAADALGPAFEVAVIRPADRNDGRGWFGIKLDPSGRLTASTETLSSLVWFSYVGFGTTGKVDGGPKWVGTDAFDITAKVDEANMTGWDALSDAQRSERVKPMIRTLLAERFKLKMHTETRITPVYAMVQVKGGAKLKAVDPPPAHVDPQAADDPGKKDKADDKPPAGGFMVSGKGWVGNAVQVRSLLGQIAYETGNTDRLVVDETGLKGYYDFAIKITHGADDPTPEQQIEDGLGLKLEPRKMAIKTYVIDSAEKPSVDGAEVQEPPTPTPVSFAQAPPAPAATRAQLLHSSDPLPAFDVATIKPNDPAKHPGASAWSQSPSQDELKMMGSLKTFLKYAYGIEDVQITGGPKWLDDDLFEIDAKSSYPASSAQMKLMLRGLLEQRFKLSTHTETKPIPVYSLTVAKGGPKLQQADASGGQGSSSGATLVRGTLDTAQLARLLTPVLGRTVIDNTGLNGAYKVDLTWAADDQPSGPSLFTAIQEQLGLKLEPTKGPVETLVIDRAEQPSEN